jgi:hypothetical protein
MVADGAIVRDVGVSQERAVVTNGGNTFWLSATVHRYELSDDASITDLSESSATWVMLQVLRGNAKGREGVNGTVTAEGGIPVNHNMAF